jgi:acyl-CoA thioester hydrolase
MSVPSAPDGWFRLRVPVRFRDLDSMGHAHHTLALIYLEEARAAFWRGIKATVPTAADTAVSAGPGLDTIDYVMAEITVRFHARIMYPSTVTAALAVRHVGRKSFTTDYEIRDEAGVLLSSGSAVQVAYDYDGSRSKDLSDHDRARLEAWRAAAAAQDSSVAMVADTAPITPPST